MRWGTAGKKRYDSLVLFTPRIYNSLHGMPFEGEEQGFPAKNEVVAYLKKYVDRFRIPIHFHTAVINVSKLNNNFIIKTKQGEYQAKNIVIVTGPFQTPNNPIFSKDIQATVNQLLSSQYNNLKSIVRWKYISGWRR